MQITVKLFANFRRGRFIAETIEFPENTCISEVISGLRIQAGEIGTIMVNNRHGEPERLLQEGDRLALFPLLGGG